MPDPRLPTPSEDFSTAQGFQFAFRCARCGAEWRSEFERHAALTLDRALGAADDLLGGMFGAARTAIHETRGPAWERGHDEALARAAGEARRHLHRCSRCAEDVCDACWSVDARMCTPCAVAPEARVAAPAPELSGVEVPECGECGTPVSGGRFCPVCSAPLDLPCNCKGCGAVLAASARFCSQCGAAA